MKHDGSDEDSEEENEEGDYTVYECPGLAPVSTCRTHGQIEMVQYLCSSLCYKRRRFVSNENRLKPIKFRIS